mgnify:FL=1
MDTSDPDIVFDNNGVSNHVKHYDSMVEQRVPPKAEADKVLESIIKEIKNEGKGKKYDCIIGVSGGVDSTYTAYLVKKMGLRPLAVHLDNGWNSELAVSNIQKVLEVLNIDLYTMVLDWEEFKDLQLSFLKASTPDGEIPTDHAIMSCLYRSAKKFGVKYIISGTNIKTEGILAKSWAQGHLDWKYIKSVHKKYGNKRLKSFPKITYLKLFDYIILKRIKKVNLLDYVDYNKKRAMKVLEDELGWVYYGGKHYESVYTRFYQGYILPNKFNIDKRRGHLSTLICSGEITREEALDEIRKDPYPNEEMKNTDKEFVLKKLDLSEDCFAQIMAEPIKQYSDYPNNEKLVSTLRDIYNRLFYV